MPVACTQMSPGYVNMFGSLYQFKPEWSNAKRTRFDQNIFLRRKKHGAKLVMLSPSVLNLTDFSLTLRTQFLSLLWSIRIVIEFTFVFLDGGVQSRVCIDHVNNYFWMYLTPGFQK